MPVSISSASSLALSRSVDQTHRCIHSIDTYIHLYFQCPSTGRGSRPIRGEIMRLVFQGVVQLRHILAWMSRDLLREVIILDSGIGPVIVRSDPSSPVCM